MKKWMGVFLLSILAIVFFFVSMAVEDSAWLINCVPLLIWILVIAIGQYHIEPLKNNTAVVIGVLYGGLSGVGAAALFLALLTVVMTDRYYRYPYDSAAFAIILLLVIVLFIGLVVVDYVKLRWKPLWVRIVTVLVTFLPSMLIALQLMAYFEKKLSQYVS